MKTHPRLSKAGRVWAADPERLAGITIAIEDVDAKGETRPMYDVIGTVAMIEIVGVMLKTYDAWLDVPPYFCFTERIRESVRNAVRDPNVSSILLTVDSPGGLALGCYDLYTDIANAAKVKPVVAFVNGMACSAAIYGIAGASEIVVGNDAFVGCIGSYMAIYDWSKFYADMGIKAHVVSSAPPLKGAGTDGTEITPEQLAMWQREIDVLGAQFKAAVKEGRRMTDEQIASVATGESWIGPDAVARGLADSVGTVDSAYAIAAARSNEEYRYMASTNLVNASGASTAAPATQVEQPKAATLAELKQALPMSTSDQREAWLEGGFTLAQAQSAMLTALAANAKTASEAMAAKDAAIAAEKSRADAAEKSAAESKAAVDALANGTKAVATSPGNGGASATADEFETVSESWPAGFDRKDWDAWKKHEASTARK